MLPLKRSAAPMRIRAAPSTSRAISSVDTEVPMSCPTTTTGSSAPASSSTSCSTKSACHASEYVWSAGLSESPKPRKSNASTFHSGRAASTPLQSYDDDGNPCGSTTSGPFAARRWT
jgi:hypothetical protein